jgi:cyanophycin synthetase
MIELMRKKERTLCLACGNNQTNHTLSWLTNTACVLMEPFDKILINNQFGQFIGHIIKLLTGPYLSLLQSLRLISWNTDSTKALTKRSGVIWEEATKRGIRMEQLVILTKPVEFYRAYLPNGKRVFFESIPLTRRGYVESYSWMDDKSILKKKLAQAHVPTPHGNSVYTWKQAQKIWSTINHPVIIKPRLGSRGRHTTTYIYTEDDLKRAYKEAKKLCFFVMVEEHLTGSVFRGTCVNGKLVGVLEGLPPKITGNGKDSIETLIAVKNSQLGRSVVKPVIITDGLKTFLKRTGYTLETIVPEKKTIELSEKIGTSYGGGSKELFHTTHPKIKNSVEQAAQVVDAGVIGFDFIISDPTDDPDTQTWGIIECNSLPFINLHHDPVEGEPINVASVIWDNAV